MRKKCVRNSKFQFLSQHHIHAFGFHYWKHGVLCAYTSPAKVSSHYGFQLKQLRNLDPQRDIFCVWSSSSLADDVISWAQNYHCQYFRVEDGFLRSIGLGCLFVKPWSLVFDTCGIYYDASRPSDLENILRDKEFSPEEIQRARQLVERIRSLGITKYNVGTCIRDLPKLQHNRPVILVPGQVEDDASIRCGTNEINNNLRLLQATRELNPSAWIIYKPHPDLQFTKKYLQTSNNHILKIANDVIIDVSVTSLFPYVDSVYTMTSLTGFEALLHGKNVHCFGLPFYAGWGMTQDSISCPRRSRSRSLEELVAAAYIDYPRYYHWSEKRPCEVEEVLSAFQQQGANTKINWKQRIVRSVLNGFKRIKRGLR
ncbi:MAG: hypothetical protein LBD40_03745 [Puniceicoccales bacterium]|jgi:capsular polysaccharide export protein|nr:hypothetical protein [Puniceicoccales bacterium]